MANTINWGKVYCEMVTNSSWGDEVYTTNAINDDSTPTCWTTFTISADTTLYSADTTSLTADIEFI